ncbi:hypothetical protein KAW65_08750 [candidate division WOR-3 bacterium]|nr:hypothetical protein [candidate division WOR-3 bacterium]
MNFKKHELHFFGTCTGSSPQSIIRADNNEEILLNCQIGKTLEQLKQVRLRSPTLHSFGDEARIDITQNQLRLLQNWRLLRKKGEMFQTNFPILDSPKTEYLRNITKVAALKMVPKLTDDIYSLRKLLKSNGYERNTYTILFSYILDNLVWYRLQEKKLVQAVHEMKTTTKKPFWAGIVWAVYPSRDFSCGTNSSVEQGVGLYVNWSSATKQINSFYSDVKAFISLFEDLKKYGKVKNERAKQFFKPYNIFDSKGNFTIPIIVEDSSNKLYQTCISLSKKVAYQSLEVLNIENLQKKLQLKNMSETIVIIYHELMWDILDYLENHRIIQKPVAFANPEKAVSKDISDLIFIVKQN